MAKITRIFQKQFGANGATSNFGKFGSLNDGGAATTKDPTVMQSLSEFLDGWQTATIGALIPAYQDMNTVCFLAFYQICYLLQMGVAEYDSSTSYYINSICQDNGQFYISLTDNNIGNDPVSSPSNWQSGIPGAEITGVIKEYAGIIAPTGYLIADGSAVSRSTYSALFAICGTNYGAGNGTTTFNIPDKRGNVGVGYKSGDINFGTLGKTGGEQTHTLITSEIPSHSHIEQYSGNDGTQAGPYMSNSNAAAAITASNASTQNTGGDGAHNNIQPYQVFNYIIKT